VNGGSPTTTKAIGAIVGLNTIRTKGMIDQIAAKHFAYQ
jgi:hypothetical protein